MDILLTPESEQKIKDEVSAGIFPDANTFVNDAITRAAKADKKKLEKLKAAVAVGIEQADQGNFSNRTIEDIIADAKAKKKQS